VATRPVRQEQGDGSLQQPLVTIALPVFNGADTLAVAVRSILMQSFRNWELIILDDASTDHSLEVMRTFDDPRIRRVEGEKNIGLSARLNMAVEMAQGEFFARMDQDDISLPERIEKQLAYLQQHPEVDLLGTATIFFRGDGEVLGCLPVSTRHADICARPWNGFYLPHPTWMGKIVWFRRHRYVSFADGAEDQHLLLRSYQTSQFACLDEPLLAYREGDRQLKRMFRARCIFAYAYIHQLSTERRYSMVIKVIALFLLKSTADVLNLVFGIVTMRNTLPPLLEPEQSAWQALWHGLRAETSGTDND